MAVVTADGRWITVEEWLLLAELMVRGSPCGIRDAVRSIHPPAVGEAAGDAGWARREQELIGVFLRLYRRGLLREAVRPGQRTTDVYELTAAGHHAVATAHRLWAPVLRGLAPGW